MVGKDAKPKYYISLMLTAVLMLGMLSIGGCQTAGLPERDKDKGPEKLQPYNEAEGNQEPDSLNNEQQPQIGKEQANRDLKDDKNGSEAVAKQKNTEEEPEFFFKEPETKPGSTLIKIFKSKRCLELYGDGELIGRFKIALGGAPEGTKEREGDSKTPEGRYYVCTRNDRSRFTYSLGVSYPNIEDAQRGLEKGLIDRETFEKIKKAQQRKQMPPWYTPLGGEICIHGGGNSTDWTLGCIAMSDEDIKILWKYAPLKTPIEIYK